MRLKGEMLRSGRGYEAVLKGRCNYGVDLPILQRVIDMHPL